MEERQRLLDQLVAAGAPGAAAWIHDEHSSVQSASGAADLQARRPMQPGLHFRAGSLTKSLVATVVLQLVAEGRLSLPDTVERWLPAILPYGDRVGACPARSTAQGATRPASNSAGEVPRRRQCYSAGPEYPARAG